MRAEVGSEGLEVRIGGESSDHVSISVSGRMHPGATDKWDGNCLVSPIAVSVGGFAVNLGAGLRIDELRLFRRELEALHRSLEGQANLESMESWLNPTVSSADQGRLSVAGVAYSYGAGSECELKFEYETEQTQLPAIIEALVAIEERYEVFDREA